MERLLLATFGTILIATATSPAMANRNVVNFKVAQNQVQQNITPFNLVSLAYQGKFKKQGVPSYNLLLKAIRFGEISGKDLVEHGISTGRLSSETINNSEYIKAVDSQLQNLSKS